MRPRRLVFTVPIVALALVGAAQPARAEGPAMWTRPVDGAVVRAFDPPQTRFGAGHLGVDVAAGHGTPVRAAGAGVVAFAGSVAGPLHVVIAHAGNLRTSYSFLATIAVRRGQRIEPGRVVGTAGGTGGGHDGTVVHFGLRSGDDYLDPMQLFRPVDLATVVHLAPTSDPPRALREPDERRGLLAGLGQGLRRGVRLAGAAAAAAGRALSSAGRVAGRSLAEAFPVEAASARGLATWLSQHGHCDPHAPDADGEGGSNHQVMVVAGIGSRLHAGGSSTRLPVRALGYEPGEVAYFSYSGRHSYRPRDTEGPLLDAARQLGAQLRERQRRQPGREVDLLAHSQGGVIVEAFLTQVYDPADPSYPPLGTVVTLSSPLRGAPLATAAAAISQSRTGRAALRRGKNVVDRAGFGLPRIGSRAARDLAEDSALMRRLDASRLPEQVDLTTIGAATDVLVPGNVATRPGARATVVVPRAADAHAAIVSDPSALRVVRAALERAPLPCRSLATVMAGELLPATITRLEREGGAAGAAAGRVADARP